MLSLILKKHFGYYYYYYLKINAAIHKILWWKPRPTNIKRLELFKLKS